MCKNRWKGGGVEEGWRFLKGYEECRRVTEWIIVTKRRRRREGEVVWRAVEEMRGVQGGKEENIGKVRKSQRQEVQNKEKEK